MALYARPTLKPCIPSAGMMALHTRAKLWTHIGTNVISVEHDGKIRFFFSNSCWFTFDIYLLWTLFLEATALPLANLHLLLGSILSIFSLWTSLSFMGFSLTMKNRTMMVAMKINLRMATEHSVVHSCAPILTQCVHLWSVRSALCHVTLKSC